MDDADEETQGDTGVPGTKGWAFTMAAILAEAAASRAALSDRMAARVLWPLLPGTNTGAFGRRMNFSSCSDRAEVPEGLLRS